MKIVRHKLKKARKLNSWLLKSDRRGSNPRSRPWQGRALPTTPLSHKRVMGIEPTYPAWKAGVLPLNYTRISIGVTGFEPATSWSQTRRSSQAEPHPVFCFCVVISVTQIVLYISPIYMSTTFLNFFQKNSSKYLPYFGKPVKSGFPDLLSSYLYTVLSSTSGCFPFSNFITM